MRAREPQHEQQLKSLEGLGAVDLKRRIAIGNHQDPEHLASEVLSTLVRTRHREAEGVVTAVVVELNRRIQILVGKRVRGERAWYGLAGRGGTVLADTIDYVWDHLLDDGKRLSNSEVRFAVFVRDRVDDYMRHLLTQKNSMESVDALPLVDDEGTSMPFINTVEDVDAEIPEEAAIRAQQTANVCAALMALTREERNAFYFRVECQYEWKRVAEMLRCSIPTANQHLKRALKKLQGALE